MKKGTVLTKEMFTFKKPGNGIKEKDYQIYLERNLLKMFNQTN